MTVIGIDPGLKGGIVVMVDGRIAKAFKMPVVKGDGGSWVDFADVASIIRYERPDLVAIEKVHSMPGQGVASVFTFGLGFGGLIGVCAGLSFPYVLVRPQNWQKVVFAGLDKDLGKRRGIMHCKQRYPECESSHKHDGIADAACIAEWASMNY